MMRAAIAIAAFELTFSFKTFKTQSRFS